MTGVPAGRIPARAGRSHVNVPRASQEDAVRAVDAARTAFDTGARPWLPGRHRGRNPGPGQHVRADEGTFDNSRAVTEFGWEITGLEQTVRAHIDGVRAEASNR